MSQKKSKWDAEVRIAKEGVETGLPPLRWGQCQCKDNELLLRFLTCAYFPLFYCIEVAATFLVFSG